MCVPVCACVCMCAYVCHLQSLAMVRRATGCARSQGADTRTGTVCPQLGLISQRLSERQTWWEHFSHMRHFECTSNFSLRFWKDAMIQSSPPSACPPGPLFAGCVAALCIRIVIRVPFESLPVGFCNTLSYATWSSASYRAAGQSASHDRKVLRSSSVLGDEHDTAQGALLPGNNDHKTLMVITHVRARRQLPARWST